MDNFLVGVNVILVVDNNNRKVCSIFLPFTSDKKTFFRLTFQMHFPIVFG